MRQLRSRIILPRGFRTKGLVPDGMAKWMGASRVHRRAATLAVAVVVAVLSAFSGSALAAEPQFTPLAASVFAPPQPVRATDGRVHLVYEINLLSIQGAVGGVPLEVQSLHVRTRGGRTLLRLAGSEIAMYAGAPAQLTRSLAPGVGGVLWLDVALARGARSPSTRRERA